MQFKRIFITGHPGAGKGLLGKKLADKLGWQFVNADFSLEFHMGRLLIDLIGNEGETHFYKAQAEMLASLSQQENIVVTTDASIVCNKNLRDLLQSEFVIYLQVSMKVQLERLIRNPAPLALKTDIKTFLNELHHTRDKLYEENCNLLINSDDNDLNNHVSAVLKKMDLSEQPTTEMALEKKDLIIFHKLLHTPVHLTEQQAVCLKLLAQGKTAKEIARELNISYRTVEGHISKMTEMLGCASSKEMLALYLEK